MTSLGGGVPPVGDIQCPTIGEGGQREHVRITPGGRSPADDRRFARAVAAGVAEGLRGAKLGVRDSVRLNVDGREVARSQHERDLLLGRRD